jgi:HAAS domain-containing protein
MKTTIHPLAEVYLRRLEHHARVLPRSERDELIAEIRDHVTSSLTPDSTEADVRNVLDALGSPADIVEAARPEHPPVRRGAREAFALVLLVSGLPPVVGWLAGVGLLLWSPLWTARQKLLGILVWPGGYVAALALPYSLDVETCRVPDPTDPAVDCTVSGPHLAVVVTVVAIVVIAPLVVAAYLYRAAGRRSEII